MPRKRNERRQPHGSAWHWKQTDCWYYTLPNTKKRVALFDEQGQRIRGKENKPAAEMALARDEIFGPLLSVLRVRSLDEAIETVNASPFGAVAKPSVRSSSR